MKNRLLVILLASSILTVTGCDRHRVQPDQSSDFTKIVVGHLVGVCAASLVLASQLGFFEEEGLDVELRWTPNPGDAMAQLQAGSIQAWNGSFTAVYRAAEEGLDAKIVAGAGVEGVSVLATSESGIETMGDLVARRGTGLRVGTQRLNTIEMTMYSSLVDHNLGYEDFEMTFFPDHFTMSAAFVAGEVDVISHIEPYATQHEVRNDAVVLARSADTWGKGSPECVTSFRTDFIDKNSEAVRRYIRALLKADTFIKENRAEAVDILFESKIWKVSREELSASLEHQEPGVDLTHNHFQMERGLTDMHRLGYLKEEPHDLLDLHYLNEVTAEKEGA